MNEHQDDIVYSHGSNTGHTFNFEDVKILERQKNVNVRRQLEGIHTYQNNGTINRALDINEIYKVLFSRNNGNCF